MFSINRFIRNFFKFLAAIASVLIPISAFASPPAGVLDDTHAAVRAVMAVQSEVTPSLMRQPEILGTAVGVDQAGTPVLTVYVDRDAANAGEVIRNLPREFRGVGVQVHLTDKFRAMAGPPPGHGHGGGVSHTAKQTPLIQVGTSGDWSKDLANVLLLRRHPRLARGGRQHPIHSQQLPCVRIGHRARWQ